MPGRSTAFSPELVVVSAGFDAYRDDPLAGLRLLEPDFAWATGRIVDVTRRRCGGRVVSLLEGGYQLDARPGPRRRMSER